MGASHTIRLGKDNGVDVGRGVEAVDAPAECFVLVTDENDRLYCPGVLDEPSPGLVNSIRNNGWEKGSLLKCANRGKKGGAPVFAVGEGRSRLKAVTIVNAERAVLGLSPIRPEFVLMTEDELYIVMHTSHNKQDRRPSFEARKWKQFCAMYAKHTLGKTGLDESETVKARKEYSEMHKCSAAIVKTWDLIMSAHPDVLRMFDNGTFKKATLLFLVENAAYADQPQAARDVIELASKPKTEDKAVVVDALRDNSQDVAKDDAVPVAPGHETVNAPEPARLVRSERSARNKALGIDAGPKMLSAKRLSALAAQFSTLQDPELVDPRVMLAYVLGQSEFDGIPIEDHPSMVQVMKMAKRGGAK